MQIGISQRLGEFVQARCVYTFDMPDREHMPKIPKHLVHNIGVANFDIHNLKILLKSETISVVPAANQIEIHPCWPSNKLIEFCRAIGIHCIAYSPLGSTQSPLAGDPTLRDIANTREKTVQQILLMWGL